MKHATLRLGAALAGILLSSVAQGAPFTATIGGADYTVQGLVGFGRIDADVRDKFGETFGSISGLSTVAGSWVRSGESYSGTFITLPDRGFNVAGTTDYAPRINFVDFNFTPVAVNSLNNSQDQIRLALRDTLKLYETTGNGIQNLTGLDPVPGGVATGGARAATLTLPELPQAFNGKLALDAEAIVPLQGGGYLISDEYGPSIYRFDNSGQFIGALPIPASLRPVRNGANDYSSNNPGAGQPTPTPTNPTAGRQNNQGLEGMSLAPDGKTLIAVLQSAAIQDVNPASINTTRRNTRIVTYDISDINNPVVTGEYALQLPTYLTANGAVRIAAQSEILALSATRFLILPRDGSGLGVADPLSRYRQVDIVDFADATNILKTPDETQIAPNGVLKSTITPATFIPWLNINNNAELDRFGLRNGGPNDENNLSEKWEGLSLLSVLDPSAPDDYFLFVANDNDFLTRNGFQVGAAYDAGLDNDTTFLAYRVTIPGFAASIDTPPMVWMLGLGALLTTGLARRRRR